MSLKATFDDYRCQKALLKNLESRSVQAGGPDFLKNVASFPDLDQLPNDSRRRRAEVASIIKRMNQSLDDFYLVGLVSAFENFVFTKLQHAAPLAASTLNDNYAQDAPIGKYRTGLAKTIDDFNRLGDLHPLFDKGMLAPDQRDKLRELIQLRSFIAHGRRTDWNSAKELNNIQVDVISAYRLLSVIAATL